MGDRSNVFIQQGVKDGKAYGVGVYSHWGGKTFQNSAIGLIPKAMRRAGDPSYFTRILIHNLLMLEASVESETGHGIWTEFPDDNEHPILVIDAETGKWAFVPEGEYRVPLKTE